ncbi:MAG: hypothetical protein WKF88_07600 [Ferruginibacter sp.]
MHIKQALLHNTGWKIITMLFSFVNNIIIVRLLGAASSADLFYTLAIFTLVSTFLRFGLENGIVYYSSKYPKRTGSIGRFIFAVSILQLLLSIVLLRYFIPIGNQFTLIWSVAFVSSSTLIYYATAFYHARKMFISINISGAFVALLQTGLLVMFYFSDTNYFIRFGIAKNINEAVLIVLAGGILLQLIFLFLYFRGANRNVLKEASPGAGIVKNMFRYSLVNFAATVLMFLLMRADFYFVEKYCNDITLANYVQVAKIGQMALVFPGLIGGVIFPYTVNAEAGFAEKIAFLCRLLSLVFIILFFLLLVFGKFIFTNLLGADFTLVYKGMIAGFAGIFCLAVNMIIISYFEGKNKQGVILWSIFISLLIILAGDHYFVPLYGYLAAAIIFSIANFFGMIILLASFIQTTRIPLKNIFLFRPADGFIFRFWK